MARESDSLFKLEGQRAVVTGAAGDFGTVFVQALAGHGCRVVAVDRDDGALAEASGGWPDSVIPFVLDVSDEARVEAFFAEQVASGLGGVDLLVNNAGVMWRSPPEETEWSRWREVLDVNLNGAFLMARAAGRLMLEQSSGAIVNISSIASVKALDNRVAYCTSKAAISHMTRVLALEWGARGVRVNGIAPGFIRSRMNADLRADPLRAKAMSEAVPLHRFGEPEELVGALLFLASPASSYVNGHILFVDGGLQIQ
jgi:NAD(P)-dependent dehydrogenase (short-subunit alcohol dehydrogenase family)